MLNQTGRFKALQEEKNRNEKEIEAEMAAQQSRINLADLKVKNQKEAIRHAAEENHVDEQTAREMVAMSDLEKATGQYKKLVERLDDFDVKISSLEEEISDISMDVSTLSTSMSSTLSSIEQSVSSMGNELSDIKSSLSNIEINSMNL